MESQIIFFGRAKIEMWIKRWYWEHNKSQWEASGKQQGFSHNFFCLFKCACKLSQNSFCYSLSLSNHNKLLWYDVRMLHIVCLNFLISLFVMAWWRKSYHPKFNAQVRWICYSLDSWHRSIWYEYTLFFSQMKLFHFAWIAMYCYIFPYVWHPLL